MKKEKTIIAEKSPYGVKYWVGSKRELLTRLRVLAHEKRTDSRSLKGLSLGVHAIDSSLHPSQLVTMASWKINVLDFERLIALLNGHGVLRFSKIPKQIKNEISNKD